MKIKEMKINNKLIDEAKLNGQIVYRLDRDRTPPEVLYVKIQLYYPLVYPSKDLYPSKNLYPKSARDLHYAYTGDTIYIEFKVDENLKENPIIKINDKEFETNLLNDNVYNSYITLTDDLDLQNNEKIEITISNLIDLMNNKANDYITQGDNGNYVILDNNFTILYTDSNDESYTVKLYNEDSLKSYLQDNKGNMKTIKLKSNKLYIKNCGVLFTKNSSGSITEEIDLSDFDTSQATTMNSMFSECIYLKSLDLSNLDTSNVTEMMSMFNQCNGLKSLDLSNFDTSNVISMASMFSSCTSLNLLDLSSFDFSKVVSYNDMFGPSYSKVPYNCLIYVKDETAKEFVLNVRSDLTNVQIKNN